MMKRVIKSQKDLKVAAKFKSAQRDTQTRDLQSASASEIAVASSLQQQLPPPWIALRLFEACMQQANSAGAKAKCEEGNALYSKLLQTGFDYCASQCARASDVGACADSCLTDDFKLGEKRDTLLKA
eukprot:TRINITY_DN2569_c0_g1_i1.p1 TRINITY_DN2569_c0_g1~~TRINITY_DN2569_c0_g1_i1.p1  ORF type:complete len:127 (+),score=18.80 TRINITY_DN2569_c0_g1_i1:404-784(+)